MKRIGTDFAENGWTGTPENFNTLEVVRGCSAVAIMGDCGRCHYRNFPRGWNGETFSSEDDFTDESEDFEEEFYVEEDMWFW